MKYLFCGLGNPGAEYEQTRHNIGFLVLDSLAQKHDGTWKSEKLSQVCEIKIRGKNIVLIKPQTYMNLSGKAVQYWLQKEKLNKQSLLVITDDLALPTGKLRLRLKGSDGGHNGLKNIQELLQSQDFARLRFGIGNDFLKGKQIDFVLGEWELIEKADVEKGMANAVEALEHIVHVGLERAMTQINAKN